MAEFFSGPDVQFCRLRDCDPIPAGFRLAFRSEASSHLDIVESALPGWEIATLADGWIMGSSYGCETGTEWKGHLGHKLAISDPKQNMLQDGLYTIQAQDGPNGPVLDKYLSVGRHASDTYVDLFHRDDGSGRQHWTLESTELNGNKVYRIHIKRGRPHDARNYLSVQEEGAENGTVDLWYRDDDSGRQKWYLVPFEEDVNCFRIFVAGGREGKMMLSRRDTEKLVELWWHAGRDQAWCVKPV